MKVLVIGGNGFVGSAYPRLFTRLGVDFSLATRETYEQFQGQRFDVVINANGNSVKFLADRDPKTEFDASVRSVVRSLEDFPTDRYVFLSSGDVYPNTTSPSMTGEASVIDNTKQSRYGFHKWVAEQFVAKAGSSPIVVRMGGFVGPGMRKNAVFDMLNNQTVWLDSASRLQFIRTDTAAELVWSLVTSGVEHQIVNLGSSGTVRIGDLHSRIGSKAEFSSTARHVNFELSTEKLQRLTGRALPTTHDEIEAFLSTQGR